MSNTISNINTTNQICNVQAKSKEKEIQHNIENTQIEQNKSQVYYGKDLVQTQNNTKIDNDLAALFQNLKGKDGKDFAETAYKGLVKYFGLDDVAPKSLSWEQSEGRPIVSDYKWYENKVVLYEDYFNKAPKEKQIGYIAHELTHLKQTTNILKTESLPLGNYAVAIAVSDFKAMMTRNPQMQNAYKTASLNGKGKEFSTYMIQKGAAQTYKELNTVFADVLKQPKHPLNSPEGQKAVNDVKAQAMYNGADLNEYNNCPLEKEAMDIENSIRLAYRQTQNK